MGLSKDKLIFDATAGQGDELTAHLYASLPLTSTTVSGKECLDVNIASPISVSTDIDGLYNVSTNPTPDTTGAILRTRGATPDATAQVEPITGAAASSNAVVAANVHGMDVNAFGMVYNGTTWDRLTGTAGVLNVNVTSGVADGAADSGNPIKIGSRAISGALPAIAATGDRADAISDLYRRLWVNDTPNVAGSNAAVSVDTTTGGVALFATPLAGRRKVEIQNLGSKDVYIGFGTVAKASGMRVAAGATFTTDLGPDLALKAIADSGTQDVRVLQLA